MTQQPTTHSLIVTTLAELIGVSILAILADTSDVVGKAAVALMAGWLLIFLISNATWLQSLTTKL
jgi:hypothetical protein